MPEIGGGKTPWQRLTGLGFELLAAVLGFTLLGLWIDRHYGTHPRGVLICAVLGIVGGLYNLIRASLNLLRPDVNPTQDPKTRNSGDEPRR